MNDDDISVKSISLTEINKSINQIIESYTVSSHFGWMNVYLTF